MLKKAFDLIGIGELLIDFTPVGKDYSEVYKANPGGAPGNVVVAMSKYGFKTAFIGAVGNDHFGKLLINTLKDFDVETKFIQPQNETFTTLAFISLSEDGERNFSFARHPGADTKLKLSVDELSAIKNSHILHFGTISLTDNPSRASTITAIQEAKKFGTIISFDPNLRPDLWESKEMMLKAVKWGLKQSNIIKISSDDLKLITDTDAKSFFDYLLTNTRASLVIYTLGEEGAIAFTLNNKQELIYNRAESINKLKVIDTTGAGDIFTAAFLSKVIPNIKEQEAKSSIDALVKLLNSDKGNNIIQESLNFANKVAGLSTTRNGGIPSIPSLDEIK